MSNATEISKQIITDFPAASSPADANRLFKVGFAELRTKLGRLPSGLEQMKLSDWYKDQIRSLGIEVNDSTKDEDTEATEVKTPKAEKPAKVLDSIICPVCNEEVPRSGGKGRPRTVHPECKK